MKQEKNKNRKLGFTLLELLVVVLIIGILAAIALPQYKMSVAKSKYNSIKTITRTYSDSIMRYYLVNNSFPSSLDELDVKVPIQGYRYCSIVNSLIACFVNVSGKSMGYYWWIEQNKPAICYTTSLDSNHVTNKLCQQEVNNIGAQGNCSSGDYCLYYY